MNQGKGISRIKFYLSGLNEVRKRGEKNLLKIE
jgi:hypothetical protein